LKDLDTRIAGFSRARRELLKRLLNAEGVEVPANKAHAQEDDIRSTMVEILRHGRAMGQRAEQKMELFDEYKDKDLVQNSYRAYHSALQSAVFEEHSVFMNLGYVPNRNPQYSVIELPGFIVNRNFINLVLEVIGDCDLRRRFVLDVGCGRGGTISVMRTYFDLGPAIGLDLVSDAVAFCNKQHRYPDTYFLHGDAEQLPFGDASFDVITNIESSHHYPDLPGFYREVARTLRAGGQFLYATLLPVEQFPKDLNTLIHLGLVLERDRDVTSNVLASCDQCEDGLFEGIEPTGEDARIADAIGFPGSRVYDYMKSGRTAYRIFRLKKDS
jgi:SAM-dependent methyltransferase